MTPQDYALTALVLAVAAFVQSTSGFGFALVSVAALPLVMELDAAIALIAFANLGVTVNTLLWNYRGFSWARARPLVLSSCALLPVGYFLLKRTDPDVMVRFLGAALVLLAATDIWLVARGRSPTLPAWSAWPLGGLGGLLGGVFNTGGPPLVVYAYSQPWTNVQTVAILQTAFTCTALFRNGLMVIGGDFSKQLFVCVLWSLVPCIVAIWLGKRLLDRLPRRALKLLVFTFVLLMGAKYLLA